MDDHTPRFFSIFTFSTKHAKNSSKSTGTKSWDEPGINGPRPVRVRFEMSNFQQEIADHGPIRPDRSADVVFVDFLDELKNYIRALGTNSSKPSCSFLESCEIPSQISKTLACTKWHLDSRYSRCYI